jgi:uncharacterized protein YbjT (DUF2867 family)
MTTDKRKAVILGASGMTGRQLLERLLADPLYAEVRVAIRNPLPTESRKLVQKRADFDHLDDETDFFAVDDVFCCLGTTMKKAGGEAAFEKVDRHYPLAAARAAQRAGAQRFLVITALGADVNSNIFYNRVKGQLEEDLKALQLPQLSILRPSLLTGRRLESRPGEEFANLAGSVLKYALIGPLKKLRPIDGGDVASAMLYLAREGAPGVNTYESDQIQEIADALRRRNEAR